MSEKKSARELEEELLAKDAAARAAADKANADFDRTRADRAKLRDGRNAEVLAAVQKCCEGMSTTSVHTAPGPKIEVRHKRDTKNAVLTIEVEDTSNNADVDFRVHLQVQRAQWNGFFKPDGTFQHVTFNNHALNPRQGQVPGVECFPGTPAEFLRWMGLRQVAGEITTTIDGMTLPDLIDSAIKKTMELAY